SKELHQFADMAGVKAAGEADGKLLLGLGEQHNPHVRHFPIALPEIVATLSYSALWNSHSHHHIHSVPQVRQQVASDACAVVPITAPGEEALGIKGTLG